MGRHVWRGFAIMALAVLVTLSIDTFSPVGNGDGLGITTIRTKKETHQLSNLPNQQIVVLVGSGINLNWVRGQSATDSLIHGIVKPDDTVPAGTNEDYSYLVTSNCGEEISLFFKADRKKVTIKYANHGGKLRTRTVPLSRLVEQSYRVKR